MPRNKADNLVFNVEKQLGELVTMLRRTQDPAGRQDPGPVKDAISSDDLDTSQRPSPISKVPSRPSRAAQKAGAGSGPSDPDVEPAAEQASSEPKQAKGKVVDAEVVIEIHEKWRRVKSAAFLSPLKFF